MPNLRSISKGRERVAPVFLIGCPRVALRSRCGAANACAASELELLEVQEARRPCRAARVEAPKGEPQVQVPRRPKVVLTTEVGPSRRHGARLQLAAQRSSLQETGNTRARSGLAPLA